MFNINLTKWQSDLLISPARFKVACLGRRSGKSTYDLVEVYLTAISKPNQVIWLVAATHQQAKTLFWDWLVTGMKIGDQSLPPMFAPELIKERCNSIGNLHLKLFNGSEIHVKGSQNADALLGTSLDLLILDEFQSQNPDVWYKLRPTLSDRKGRAIITGTPRGYNHFYDMWYKGSDRNPDKLDDWHSIQIMTKDAGTIAAEEIEAAKRDMSDKQFKQEYEASFESLDTIVYCNFDKKENNTPFTIADFHYDYPLHVGLDFNKRIMATTVSVFTDDGNAFTVDEIVGCEDTPALIKQLNVRYPGRKIIVHPDTSGDKSTGITDFTLLTNANFTVEKPNIEGKNSNPRVWDRVNVTQAMLLNAAGQRRLKINVQRCPELVKCLQMQTIDKYGDPDKTTGLDHLPDALGYSLYRKFRPRSENAGRITQR